MKAVSAIRVDEPAGNTGLATAKQPPGLQLLFFTEMWERFSYYGMRALLVLYLVNSVGFSRADALQIYAIYTGLVWLSPLLGGIIADRWLGYRKAILIGGIVMACGHFAMAFPGMLNLGLGLIIFGNGFFKANIASLLGTLYTDKDSRRDGGFTIFYMGINLGGFIGPLIAGSLGEGVGWHWGFASAGIGMCLGLVQFVWGQARLGVAGLPPGKTRLERGDWLQIAVISAAAIPIVYGVLLAWPLVAPLWSGIPVWIRIGIPLAATAAFMFNVHATSSTEDWQRVYAVIICSVFAIAFWMAFEQAGGTMSLFADKQTDRHLFGWEIPASIFQSINSLCIFALAPLVAMMWVRLDRSRFAMGTVMKMALGLFIVGLSFVVLAYAQSLAVQFGTVSPLWLVGVFVLQTIGELFLSPVGMSMVTKLSPARYTGLLMGVWYCAIAIASYLAGTLENTLAESGIPVFTFLIGSSIAAGLLLVLIRPLLRRWMQGKA
jgi:POT family proton-dependent oligopeptide transporter